MHHQKNQHYLNPDKDYYLKMLNTNQTIVDNEDSFKKENISKENISEEVLKEVIDKELFILFRENEVITKLEDIDNKSKLLVALSILQDEYTVSSNDILTTIVNVDKEKLESAFNGSVISKLGIKHESFDIYELTSDSVYNRNNDLLVYSTESFKYLLPSASKVKSYENKGDKYIIFGVDDETREVVGIEPESFVKQDDVDSYLESKIEPFPEVTCGLIKTEDGKNIGYIKIKLYFITIIFFYIAKSCFHYALKKQKERSVCFPPFLISRNTRPHRAGCTFPGRYTRGRHRRRPHPTRRRSRKNDRRDIHRQLDEHEIRIHDLERA